MLYIMNLINTVLDNVEVRKKYSVSVLGETFSRSHTTIHRDMLLSSVSIPTTFRCIDPHCLLRYVCTKAFDCCFHFSVIADTCQQTLTVLSVELCWPERVGYFHNNT